MRRYFVFLLLFSPVIVNSQIKSSQDSINRFNYFKYFAKSTSDYGIKTIWLNEHEILQIIYNELTKKGYKLHESILYKFGDTLISLGGYDFYQRKGYFFQDGHGSADDDKENPKIYYQYVLDDSISTMYDMSKLPSNIKIFKEDWYWYQEIISPNGSHNFKEPVMVTRDIILKILREDINYFFENVRQ